MIKLSVRLKVKNGSEEKRWGSGEAVKRRDRRRGNRQSAAMDPVTPDPDPSPSSAPVPFALPATPAPGATPELTPAAPPLTPEEQMARFEQELKETDWGHQPC